jgi:hypothetical protein
MRFLFRLLLQKMTIRRLSVRLLLRNMKIWKLSVFSSPLNDEHFGDCLSISSSRR